MGRKRLITGIFFSAKQRNICMTLLLPMIFTIANSWNYIFMNIWINKIWFSKTGMHREHIILSKSHKFEKIISWLKNLKVKVDFLDDENRIWFNNQSWQKEGWKEKKKGISGYFIVYKRNKHVVYDTTVTIQIEIYIYIYSNVTKGKRGIIIFSSKRYNESLRL